MIGNSSAKNKTSNQSSIIFYAVIGLLGLITLGLIIAAILHSTTNQDKIMSEIVSQNNIQSLSIQKNGYKNVFSFDGFIKNDELTNIYQILKQNNDIEILQSSIDFPAFLSIRKASVYVDMAFSEYLGSNDIIQGRMYNTSNNANEVVIGSSLAERYGIPNNSVVAIIVKDFDDVYSVTNLNVIGISHFEHDEAKNNKGYISHNKFREVMAINIPSEEPFTQKIDIRVKEEADIKKVSDYIKENIDTNIFGLNEITERENILTEEIVKQSSKPIMAVFIIAIILTICSVMRILLFKIKNETSNE